VQKELRQEMGARFVAGVATVAGVAAFQKAVAANPDDFKQPIAYCPKPLIKERARSGRINKNFCSVSVAQMSKK
jgi:hypothetical protein